MTNTIASDTLVEAIARAVAERLESFDVNGIPQAALTAITEAGYVILPRVPADAMIAAAAQAIEARSGETEGLDPQGESAALQGAPYIMPPPLRDAGPLESEEGE